MLEQAGEIQPWLGASFVCGCGQEHTVPIRSVVIERGALAALPPYAAERGYSELLIVADRRTMEAAGEELLQRCKAASLQAQACVLAEDERGELAADERAIVQLMLHMTPGVQAIAAVGSGTIHDIVRFVAHRTGRVFLSVPTAPSVDGFASVGAPLIIGGFKQTIPASAPEAIFADLQLLARAPQAMIAAGFGDMLGKYTALADWQLGRELFGEPYCELAAEMTRQGLALCMDHAEEIAAGTELGVRKLMEGLTLSGISMLLVGHSRPASGGEHHLSHFWEMRFIQQRRRALLHGAKVGVAAVQMAALYEAAAGLTREAAAEAVAARLASGDAPSVERMRAQIEAGYGTIAQQVLAENGLGAAADSAPAASVPAASPELPQRIAARWDAIREICRSVPSPQELADALRRAGGPAAAEELGIEPELLAESLRVAKYVRNRYTIMRLCEWL
ncbi:sn-glycerol-1-phosphate dehydrogenase [Paenibacillus doosanensis]|uniref:sn-glycerol-1-phosphate dehydrogenase n=1 Tax=Paenibacillus doosanensis TaxID=1229154 RepID=UPI00218060D3|nr:sn-glycerol-1-phosphate dehydrogenase [Paenibacillus doosanensis]MCS7462788.1 sn-glycerol-1-phosphate dehydrogenase [Paenibacillus doosanensis]